MKNILIFLLLTTVSLLQAQNQTMCGNGDFESGTLDPSEWDGFYNFSDYGCGVVTFTSGLLPGVIAPGNETDNSAHHTIVDNTITTNDPNILVLSTTPPFPATNRYSLRLGNDRDGSGHEKVSKTFVVSATNPILRFWFASVMENPGDDHDCIAGDFARAPGFGVNIYNQSTSTSLNSLVDLGNGSNFNEFNAANPFFQQSSSNANYYYTDWNCIEVDISRYIGDLITVEFYNRDCRKGGHFGYTYLDNLCIACTGAPTGSIDLDPMQDTCGLPGTICVNYTLPTAGNLTGDVQIDLTVMQNGTPVTVLSSPVLTSGNQHCFILNNANLAGLNTGLPGFDFQVTGHFTITNMGTTTVLPDKYIGSQPDGVKGGQNNDYEFVCENQCDKLEVSDSLLVPERCCYSIDLLNNYGPTVAYVEANLLGSDWVFGAGTAPGAGWSWFGSSGPQSLPITVFGPGGSPGIPTGPSPDALVYCFEPAVPSPSLPQIVVFTWYEENPLVPGYRAICQDTLFYDCLPEEPTECLSFQPDISCNPNNPYEYIVNFTVTNLSSFPATQVNLDNLTNPIDFGFSDCNSSNHLPSIAIPLSPPLQPGNTSAPLCVKIHSTNPILSPTIFQFYAGLASTNECCTEEQQVEIDLLPCCDPCGDIRLDVAPLVNPDDGCCHSIDIVNNCGYQFFRKVETSILTPGVTFGYHAIGGPDASDWNVGYSTPTNILWEMNGGQYIPQGTTMDIIQFCLDNITSSTPVPQEVLVSWIAEDMFGQDSVACTDTLRFDCEAPNECLDVTNQLMECFPDSGRYCYTFTVTNTSTIPFGATNLDLFEVSGADIEFMGTGGTFPLPPLNTGDSIRLTVCWEPDTFPMVDSCLVFQYRLRYILGDTCCYESKLDTIKVPDCMPQDTCNKDCCYPSNVQMPTGLTPNGDGYNDLFQVQGIDNCQKVSIMVFNRWGNIVYEMEDYDNSWDGSNQSGSPLPQGTYYILLKLHDSGSSIAGYVDLRRQ